MTSVASGASPPASAPASGASAEEKKTAAGAVAVAFAVGGPVGAVVMALAIGIEQAFGKSGWDQPGWLGGDGKPLLSPQEIQQRHDDAVQRAQEYLAEAQAQADIRNAAIKQHQQEVKGWLENGRQGPKPTRPPGRGAGEFLGDLWNTSKSRYMLFDDKMAKGNEKITGTYPAIADFFRGLWNFVTGFAEGVSNLKAGWNEYQQLKNQPDTIDEPPQQPTPNNPCLGCGGFNSSFERLCYWCRNPQLDAEGEPVPPAEDEPPVPPAIAPSSPGGEPEPVLVLAGAGNERGELNSGPDGPGEGTVEGESMTTDETATLPAGAGGVAPAHMGPQGETNLDLLHQAFAPAVPVLKSVSEQVDALKLQSLAVSARIGRIAALCAVAGAPATVYQMMEQARLLTGAVNAGLVDIDTHNEVARELTDEALIGLLPAQDDLNTTRAEQASGDLYNRVGH